MSPSPLPQPPTKRALAPLFIVGCGRSGTTLLRLMLNMHPDLCIPEESHVIYQIARLCSFGRWPAKGSPEFAERFLKHVEESRFMRNWQLAPGALRTRVMGLSARDFGSLLRAMYEEFRAPTQKPMWGDKTPMHVQYMWIVRHFFPNARFVHVIRDARDVAQSVAAKSWGPRHISHAGHYWKWLVLSGMVSGRILGAEHYHELRFEDLVRQPEASLRSICSFAGLAYSDQLLKYHESSAAADYAAKGNAGSKRLQQVLDPERIFLWRQTMPPSDVRSIERQAGALLELAGYEHAVLSARQARDLEGLEHLLGPAQLQRLDREAREYHPGRAAGQLKLHRERLLQATSFVSGNWQNWASAGIRWQRNVAASLGQASRSQDI